MFAQLDLFHHSVCSEVSLEIEHGALLLEKLDPELVLVADHDSESYFVPERQFSDFDVQIIHRAVFDEAMIVLGRSYKETERKKDFSSAAQGLSEVVEWLFAPDIVRGIRSVERPFTFQACCAVIGVNPERQIDAIFDEISVCRNMNLLVNNGFADFLSEYSRPDVLKAAKSYGIMKSFENRYRPVIDDGDDEC